MEIGIGDGGVPADEDVIADTQFEFAKQHGIGEVTVIANLHPALAANGKVDAVHGAVGTDQEGLGLFAQEAFEGVIRGD